MAGRIIEGKSWEALKSQSHTEMNTLIVWSMWAIWLANKPWHDRSVYLSLPFSLSLSNAIISWRRDFHYLSYLFRL